jgi:hypothetical protein
VLKVLTLLLIYAYFTNYITLSGWRVAQICVIFRLSPRAEQALLGHNSKESPGHLAYVKWFTPFPSRPDPNSGMYKVSHSYKDGYQVASVIPVSLIKRSVHLIPQFGAVVPRSWTNANVLEECKHFYVNPFTDCHTYISLY